MSQFINCKLTWVDNSSGDLDETGQEIQIYTDSPSFRPDVPIVSAEGNHPWMKLLPVAAGVTEAEVPLQIPVTFVTFRVRQYNASGFGPWHSLTGSTFPVAGNTGTTVPPAPSGAGFVILDSGVVTPPPPPPPPVDPPPPPPPAGGGAASNYTWTSQFSGVQGQNQWSYLDSAGNNLTYNSTNSIWNGAQLYQGIWSGGMHPGTSVGVVLRWTAPSGGEVAITGTARLGTTSGSSGVSVEVKKNSTTLVGPSNITTTQVIDLASSTTVVGGDTIDFIVLGLVGNTYCTTLIAPTIQFTTDGSTPVDPVLSTLTPASLSMSVGGIETLTATLSSAALSAATVAFSSSDATKVTVPASIIIPAGSSSGGVSITGVAAGTSNITATYNSTNKVSAITVANPPTGTWPNGPSGGTVLLDHNFSAVSPLTALYNNTQIVSDASAPLSPSSVARHRLEAFAGSGGDETVYTTPAYYRELYCGFMWRMNPQFQGRIVANKLWFLKNNANTLNMFFGIYGGPNSGGGSFYIAGGPNTSGINNSHLFGGDPIGNVYPNTGASAVVVPGVWYKLESRIRCSTSRTSRDGRVRVWLNGVLIIDYQQFNYCGPNGEGMNYFVWNETWDGAQDMGISNTVAWEHYMDHIYLVGAN